MNDISLRAFLKLAAWWEAGITHRSGSQMHFECPDLVDELISSGVLQPDQFDDWYTDPSGKKHPVIEVAPGVFKPDYLECDSFPVPEFLLRRYRTRENWLLQFLAEQVTDNHLECWSPDTLWFVGFYQRRKQRWPVWLARRLNEEEAYDRVAVSLNSHNLPAGFILTLNPPSHSACQRLTDKNRVVALTDVLAGDPIALVMDQVLEELPILWDETAGVLQVNGLPDWLVDGAGQRTVVSLLYDAWLNSRKGVAREVLQEEGITSKTPQQLWGRRTEWKSYIDYGSNRWWLIEP